MSTPLQSISLDHFYYVFNSNRYLHLTHDSLSLNFTPHIQLIILISARCNATSFSLFKGHVSLLCNIELLIHELYTFPRNKETSLAVRREASDLNLTNHSESWQSQQHQHLIHRQHTSIPRIVELIHYFCT